MSEVTESLENDNSIDSNSIKSGHVLGGKYRVIRLLGKGGMGSVYEVNQIFLNTNLALKVLDRRSLNNEVHLRRFRLEAKAAYALNHNNLVKVHDFGILDSEQPYLVMDLISGSTLADYIKSGEPLRTETLIAIFKQVCDGLSYAHDQSVIHRDIKPSNIMLVEGIEPGKPGSVKVLDFGIAKIGSEDGGELQALTRTGEVFGSPFYMSPEQCAGAVVDHRSDIYSLGCSMFETFTGTPPHVGVNALRTMMLHQNQQAPLLKEASLGKPFPEALEQIVGKMLNKAPHERYQSMDLVARDLATISRDGSQANAPPKMRKNLQWGKFENKTISISISNLLLLILSAVSTTSIAFLFYSKSFHASEPIAKSMQATSANKSEKDPDASISNLLSSELDESVHKLKQKEMVDKTTFAGTAPIESRVVLIDGTRCRQITFPKTPIGVVVRAERLGKAGAIRTQASGTQVFPLDAKLVLEIGGSTYESFEDYSILKKIGTNVFTGLVITAPERVLSGVTHDAAKEAQNLGEIIKIASGWNDFDLLVVNYLKFNKVSIDALNRCTRLRTLILYKLQGSESELAHRGAFLKQLNSIHIAECAVSELICTLADSSRLTHLALENNHVTPSNLRQLRKCPHLTYLQFQERKIDKSIIDEIIMLPKLKALYLKDTPILSLQLRYLLEKGTNLEYIAISGKSQVCTSVVDFSDKRLHLVAD